MKTEELDISLSDAMSSSPGAPQRLSNAEAKAVRLATIRKAQNEAAFENNSSPSVSTSERRPVVIKRENPSASPGLETRKRPKIEPEYSQRIPPFFGLGPLRDEPADDSSRSADDDTLHIPASQAESPEFDLLQGTRHKGRCDLHEVATAPIITRDAFQHGAGLSDAVPQYGLIGAIQDVVTPGRHKEQWRDSRLYLNTNTPYSAVVCGVQGSGKSHTVAVLLESMLISNPAIGKLQKPLSAMVFHVGESSNSLPCEAAFQAFTSCDNIRPPEVTVFVSPSQIRTRSSIYRKHFGALVEVLPLRVSHAELDSKGIMSMMSVSNTGEPPLYVQIILNILRDLGEEFTYGRFQAQLAKHTQDFNPQQLTGLKQRIALLESFIDHRPPQRPRFESGRITIVDLSDPFIDPSSACAIFEIMTRIFVKVELATGKVLVVDEAHKYLRGDKSTASLTQELISVVRQQRHLGMRVIISTQEPTVVPHALLDLCSLTVLHRFSSLSWLQHLSKHVCAELADSTFDRLVKLQAIILAPSGLAVLRQPDLSEAIGTLGRRYLIVKTRRRVTADGGMSILVV